MPFSDYTKPNPLRALVERFGEHDYTLTFPSARTVGGRSRASLERLARKEGYTPEYVDRRKPRLRSEVWMGR